jgi:hypothetical protein
LKIGGNSSRFSRIFCCFPKKEEKRKIILKTSKRAKTKKSETKKKTERNEKQAEHREITGNFQQEPPALL